MTSPVSLAGAHRIARLHGQGGERGYTLWRYPEYPLVMVIISFLMGKYEPS